ncbi:hypothetical protein SELMODRAFT_22868, partial [Selaginella moellendorffii]
HVLVVPFPAQGHINPMLHLSDRLASMGVLVTFVNTRSNHDKILKSNCEADSLRFVSVPDDCLPQAKLLSHLELFLDTAATSMRDEVEKIVEQLMGDLSAPTITCIISDAFFYWTRDVAQKFGFSRACFWTSSATFALISCYIPFLRENLEDGGTLDSIPGLPPIPAHYLPSRFLDGREDHIRHRMSIDDSDAWALVNSFDDLEKEQFDQLHKKFTSIVAAGPFIPSKEYSRSVWEQELCCMNWLDEQPPQSVLYISFGSLATLSLNDTQELANGLEQSEYAFLWVARLDLIEENSEFLQQRFKHNKRGMFVTWAPQMKVLQHSSVAAFLTHCGWNSLMEAIVSGVPVLGWPCFAEQKLNCLFAVDPWQVG